MRFTSSLPGDLYTLTECVEQVEYFTQQIKQKFNSEYGPDIHNKWLENLEFLHLVEKFLAEIFQKLFDYNKWLENLEFLHLVEKFLAEIFQKLFDYNTRSESSGSESSEEENTEDST